MVALDAELATHLLAERGTVDVLGGAFYVELYGNFAGPGNTFRPLRPAVAVRDRRRREDDGGRDAGPHDDCRHRLGLILAGGIGNLLDRILRAFGPLRGRVVDWLKATLPSCSMNLADLYAAVVVMLVGARLSWWRDRSPDGRVAPPPSR